jgi:hypothetical protein
LPDPNNRVKKTTATISTSARLMTRRKMSHGDEDVVDGDVEVFE